MLERGSAEFRQLLDNILDKGKLTPIDCEVRRGFAFV